MSKKRKKRIFDEVHAEQADYDERTRLLRERVARGMGIPVDQVDERWAYDERTRLLEERIAHHRAKAGEEPRESS